MGDEARLHVAVECGRGRVGVGRRGPRGGAFKACRGAVDAGG